MEDKKGNQQNIDPNYVPFHIHNGADSPRIDPSNLRGFRIVNVVPTFAAEEGTIVLYWDKSTTYRLYARINNGWRQVALT